MRAVERTHAEQRRDTDAAGQSTSSNPAAPAAPSPSRLLYQRLCLGTELVASCVGSYARQQYDTNIAITIRGVKNNQQPGRRRLTEGTRASPPAPVRPRRRTQRAGDEASATLSR